MKHLLLALCAVCWVTSAHAQNPYPACGNGVIEQGEFCDDGNNVDGDLCSANCLFGAPPSATPYDEVPYQPYSSLRISPGGAFGLSLASTILTGGAIPSLGHMYAGEYRRAMASWGIRMGSGVVAFFGAIVFVTTNLNNTPNCGNSSFGCGFGALILGTGGIMGTMIFDVADAPGAALRSNQRGKRPWQVGLAPSAMPALGGGMSLQLKF